MITTNNNERHKMQLKFASLYIASLVLLMIILVSLWKKKDMRSKANSAAVATKEQKLLQRDDLLHDRLAALQILDETLIYALTDSTLAKSPGKLKDSLVAISSDIYNAEDELRRLTDSIERESTKENDSTAFKTIILPGFRTALSNHKAVYNLCAAIAAHDMIKNDLQSVAVWQSELQKKDQQVKMLEEQLKKALNEKPVLQAASISVAGKLPREVENKLSYLQNVNQALKDDNDRLLMEIARYKKLTESEDAVSREKRSDLEKKVKELTEEIYLAHVDCNLSRADAKQIVYNAKQRKDLLAEAMAMLKNLSQNGSAGLQKKIKEKTLQLQTIANTVRD